MTTTFSVLVENKFWVLAKISRLFSRHMFNIQSLTVAPTLNSTISCMTIDVEESEDRIRRMGLELEKMTNVLSVSICDEETYIETEMVLVKIRRSSPQFLEFISEADRFQARVIYRQGDVEILEFSGDKTQIRAFIDMSKTLDAESIFRTGTLAMPK